MLPSAVIFGISALFMAILNSHQKFFIPALMPAMYQFGIILGVLVLVPHMGIFGLGWGVIIGSCFHLVLQIPVLLSLNAKYFPTFGLHSHAVYEVARLMGPRLLGVAAVQLNFWVNTILASRMVEGSVTAVVLGFTLMLMPQAAIAQSVAIAAMPTFSKQVALGRLEQMRASLAATLRGMLLLSLPASVGLIILREPLITFLYQRGEFNQRSTELVAWALLWYAVGLVAHSVVEIMSRAFYSLHDTKTPVFVGIGAMGLNVVFSISFAAGFMRLGWLALGGLALANSLATTLEMGVLYILMRRRLEGLDGKRILIGFTYAVIGTLFMSIGLWIWLKATYGFSVWIVVIAGICIGAFIYTFGLVVFGVKEARALIQSFRTRASVIFD
jgi:putative peptidoglycan lipid II flippase